MNAADISADAPVLFFDSGVGGLSILEPARKLLPNMPVVYAADRAGFPYGTRTEAEIAARVPALLGRLVERLHNVALLDEPDLLRRAVGHRDDVLAAQIRATDRVGLVGVDAAIDRAAARGRAHPPRGSASRRRRPSQPSHVPAPAKNSERTIVVTVTSRVTTTQPGSSGS